jgi:hypothetical protein
MYSTQIYIYQQIQRVLVLDTSDGDVFDRRWNPVYAKKLTINKGVDNVILFEFINQDQKPVNITGSALRFKLINLSGTAQLIEKEMVIINAQYGRAKVTLTAAETTEFPPEPSSYAIERLSGNLVEAVFVDAQAQARGDVDILDSVKPAFVPSTLVTIPDIYGPDSYIDPVWNSNTPDWALNPPGLYGNVYNDPQRFSSHVPTNGTSLTTFQMEMDHYTGNVKAQGAQNYESVWVDVTDVQSYYNKSGATYLNVVGYHPLIRLVSDQWPGTQQVQLATATATGANGVITAIAVNQAGYGYLAPPRVSIIGLGAGAVAEAEVTGGQVSAINVINGGTGYVANPQQSQQIAIVRISRGAIVSILVR